MYQIQKATPEHLDEIISLRIKLMNLHKDIDPDFFAEANSLVDEYKMNLDWYLRDTTSVIFIAKSKNRVIGYITAGISWFKYESYNSNNYCTIGDIMVDEDYRQLGIGKAFIAEMKKWAKSESTHKIILDVFSKNTNALNFYKKLGFNENFNNLILEF